jgi:cell division protein FtsB
VSRSIRPDRRNGLRQWFGQFLVLCSCLTATAYFGYHVRYGRHGIEARNELIERSALLDFEIKGLETVRSKLRRDVALLRPEVPNSDMVEEIARDVLGYVRSDDKIIAAH